MEAGLFSSADAGVARVALPVPVDRLFDYAVPPELASAAVAGTRVRVPMGRRSQTGLIVERIASSADVAPGALKAIEAVLDEEPVLPASLLSVVIEEAGAVLCPIGIALHAALPAGSTPRQVPGFALSPRGRQALASGALPAPTRDALASLLEGPAAASELAQTLTADEIASLERDRILLRATIQRGPRVRAARERIAKLAPNVDLAAASAELGRAPRQAELLRMLAERGPVRVAALAADDPRASTHLRALVKRGLAEVTHEPPQLLAGFDEPTGPVQPTSEQAAACEVLEEAIRARRAERFLLHGVTGSGKTEVYLRAVAAALESGRQALVLVPEITLTHQIVARLRGRFGDQLAVLHSGLRPGERLAQWERLRHGKTPIAVGARSALFAPIRDLGVIVIDEEHDNAYKNEEGFRYHARNLAARRAATDDCPLLLGSATPALETRYAADRGSLRLLRLEHRIGSQPLPSVEVVDLARERAALPRGRKLILTSTMQRALRQTLEDGAQAILFLNRRGFSTQISCFACGFVSRCKHCDISLTYHAQAGVLLCHYCDHQERPPDLCTSCGEDATGLLGVGTERLEEEVRMHLPDARVARLDRDTAAKRGVTEAVLRGLQERSLDIVIGTQMVAKGHDFPGVRLVGVVNADLGLDFPDFRAAERTFQILTQVAGRAGRQGSPGRVVLQAYRPDHYAIRPVAQHDYETFYQEELRQRRPLGYPPFGRLAQIRVSAQDEGLARLGAEALARVARTAAGGADRVEVLGPAPAAIARLRGRHRFQLLLKHRSYARLRAVAIPVTEEIRRLPEGVRGSVDLNPIDML